MVAPGPAFAEELWGSDKALHLTLSAAAGFVSYGALRLLGSDGAPLYYALSVGIAFLPGLAKEIYDSGRPGNSFSRADLLWDFVGAAVGAALALAIDLLLQRARAPRRRSALSPLLHARDARLTLSF